MLNNLVTASNGNTPQFPWGMSPFSLEISNDLLSQVPTAICHDQGSLTEYLQNALKLGLNALSLASISLDTTHYIDAVRSESQAIATMHAKSIEEIEQLFQKGVIAENSVLATALQDHLHRIERLSQMLQRDLADPTNISSIPNQVKSHLEEAFERIDSPIVKLLNASDPASPLSQLAVQQKQHVTQLLEEQRQALSNHRDTLTELQTRVAEEIKTVQNQAINQIKSEFELIKQGLGVQDLLEKQQALQEKSPQKGRPFEGLVAEHLQGISYFNEDNIFAIEDSLIEGTKRKIGDVLIEVCEGQNQGQKIVIEAKSGDFTLSGKRSLQAELQEAIEYRQSRAGIAVVNAKYAKANQPPYKAWGNNMVIVTVDPENIENGFLPLELAYITLRARLLTQTNQKEPNQINWDAVEQTINKVTDKLGMAQSMRTSCTSVKTTMDKIRQDIDSLTECIANELNQLKNMLKVHSES